MHLQITVLLALAASCLAASVRARGSSAAQLLRTVYQFTEGTYLKDIAVRANGQLVFTVMNAPYLYTMSPNETKPHLVYSFPEATGAFGIVEMQPDVFAVVTGNYSIATRSSVPQSFSLWTVDMHNFGKSGVAASKTVDLPSISMPQHLAYLPGSYDVGDAPYLAFADSVDGRVYKVNLLTFQVSTCLDSDDLKPSDNGHSGGVTGLLYEGRQVLWYTNSDRGYLGYAFVAANGVATTKPVVFSQTNSVTTKYSGFARGPLSNLWIASGTGNTIEHISQSGEHCRSAGDLNSTMIAEPNSLAFGRVKHADIGILYIVTGGGMTAPINGTTAVGGQVLALNTALLPC